MTRNLGSSGVEAQLRKAQRTLDEFLKAPPAENSQRDAALMSVQCIKLDEALDEWSLPRKLAKVETRGRPAGATKYVVRVMPAATAARVIELIRESNPDADTIRRLLTDLACFQQMNRIVRPDLALFSFVVDIGMQGLKPSTCKSYLRLMLEGSARAGKKIAGPLIGDLFKALNLMEAEDDVEHAVDVPIPVLEEMLRNMRPGKLRLTFFLLLYVGCRAADGMRLTAGAFRVQPDGGLRVHFRITKNHRTR